jgi:hypothetical protein
LHSSEEIVRKLEERDAKEGNIRKAATAKEVVQGNFRADCQRKKAAAISAAEYCP